MNTKFETIMFYVKDIKNLKNFYVDNFNLKVLEEDDVWILLNAGNANIGFHKIGVKYLEKIDANHKFNNNAKIVFEIDIDIESARNELIPKDIIMREIKSFENYDYWLCDGLDPEGNVFQLKSKK